MYILPKLFAFLPIICGAYAAPTTLKEITDRTEHAVAIVSGTCQKHNLLFSNRVRIHDILFPEDSFGPGFSVNPCSQCISPPRNIGPKNAWQHKTLDDLFTHLGHVHKSISSYQLVIHSVRTKNLRLCSEKLSHLDIQDAAEGLFVSPKLIIDLCPQLKHMCTQDVTMSQCLTL